MSGSPPTFVVVGHVNKGKSSLVATLLEDPSIPVDLLPGTTTAAAAYAFRLDGREVFRLIDTPGFQDAGAALAWLEERAPDAGRRGEALAAFMETFADGSRFRDEVELLRPLLDADTVGLLYVVDASRPYRATHEAEMEVLRWSGRPGMALMNRIGDEDHRDSWQPVLQQFFSVVRPFNAHEADAAERLALLRTFAALDAARGPEVAAAAEAMERRWAERHRAALASVAGMLVEAWSHVETAPVPPGEDGADAKAVARLQERYESRLRSLEEEERRQVEGLFGFPGLRREEQPVDLLPEDLFDHKRWRLFGLSQGQLTARAAAAGAAGGGVLDLMSAGLSLGTGMTFGAAVGAAGAWFGSRQVAKAWRPEHDRLAKLLPGEHGHVQAFGPIRNAAFAWVLLDRALVHLAAVARRAHARRDPLRLEELDAARATRLPETVRKEIDDVLRRCQAAGREGAGEEARTRLTDRLAGLLVQGLPTPVA